MVVCEAVKGEQSSPLHFKWLWRDFMKEIVGIFTEYGEIRLNFLTKYGSISLGLPRW